MLDWFRKRAAASTAVRESPAPQDPPVRPMTGKYALLYKYLANRYADTVVLTFAQIEDLIGFQLPDQARRQREWWTDAAAAASSQSEAWTRARRIASPNLLACTVAFDRA